ncbi:hypothetical protein V6N13_059134 [Hibiscus sabdariffa]
MEPDIIVEDSDPIQQVRQMKPTTVVVGGSLAVKSRNSYARKRVRVEYNVGAAGGDRDIQILDSHFSRKEQLSDNTGKSI